MSVSVDRIHHTPVRRLHPIHAVLLAGTVPLFLGAVLSDIAYSVSYEIQWNNFSAERRGGRSLLYLLFLLATWILSFINALVHARDAWASMPTGLILSVIVVLLACAATWAGFSSVRAGGAQ